MTLEAGITWLHNIAGLNPATSHVIREWDRRGASDFTMFTMRADLLEVFRAEREARRNDPPTINRVRELVEA